MDVLATSCNFSVGPYRMRDEASFPMEGQNCENKETPRNMGTAGDFVLADSKMRHACDACDAQMRGSANTAKHK